MRQFNFLPKKKQARKKESVKTIKTVIKVRSDDKKRVKWFIKVIPSSGVSLGSRGRGGVGMTLVAGTYDTLTRPSCRIVAFCPPPSGALTSPTLQTPNFILDPAPFRFCGLIYRSVLLSESLVRGPCGFESIQLL